MGRTLHFRTSDMTVRCVHADGGAHRTASNGCRGAWQLHAALKNLGDLVTHLKTISMGRGDVRMSSATSFGSSFDAGLPPTAATPNPAFRFAWRIACDPDNTCRMAHERSRMFAAHNDSMSTNAFRMALEEEEEACFCSALQYL